LLGASKMGRSGFHSDRRRSLFGSNPHEPPPLCSRFQTAVTTTMPLPHTAMSTAHRRPPLLASCLHMGESSMQCELLGRVDGDQQDGGAPVQSETDLHEGALAAGVGAPRRRDDLFQDLCRHLMPSPAASDLPGRTPLSQPRRVARPSSYRLQGSWRELHYPAKTTVSGLASSPTRW
jgi:hypothetical protein